MAVASTLILMIALAAPGDIQVLLFKATWCPGCQEMETTLRRLQDTGVKIEQIDIDVRKDVASQFGVREVPCLVFLRKGQEYQRLEGPASYDRILQILGGDGPDTIAGNRPRQASDKAAGWGMARETASTAREQPAAMVSRRDTTERGDATAKAMAASVRIRVEDAQGHSYGTGTIIDTHGQEALVLTCGHIFRESQGKGKIWVELFPQSSPMAGVLVHHDLKSDIGFVAIRVDRPVAAVPIPGPDYAPREQDHVFSIGCDRGADPTVRTSHVVAVNRFLGPANLVVAGQPVDGRSGGGLFTRDGQLIGVCNAADPQNDEGLFAALPVIQQELERLNLGYVFQKNPDIALASHQTADPAPADEGLPLLSAQHEPQVPGTRSIPSLDSRPSPPHEPEIVCIVRSRAQPNTRSEVIVLDNPSADFLNSLSRERQSQTARFNTGMRLRKGGK